MIAKVAATQAVPTPFVDWNTLGKVIGVSLAAGIGLILIVSLSIISYDWAKRSSSGVSVRVAGWVLTVVSLAGIASALIWGLLTILKKG